MRVAVLFSGGKDSTFALHWAFEKGFDVACLITLEPERSDSWMFHYPNVDVTKLQAEALGIPQLYFRTSGVKDRELDELREALKRAVEEYGVEGLVAGAILSDYQRMNIALLCRELALRVYMPLWRIDPEDYMRRLVRYGFEILVTRIAAYGLPRKFLGKVLTEEDVEEIIRLARRYGFNPAFEGGEAETLVLHAPLFRRRIKVLKSREVRISEYEWVLVIEMAELER